MERARIDRRFTSVFLVSRAQCHSPCLGGGSYTRGYCDRPSIDLAAAGWNQNASADDAVRIRGHKYISRGFFRDSWPWHPCHQRRIGRRRTTLLALLTLKVAPTAGTVRINSVGPVQAPSYRAAWLRARHFGTLAERDCRVIVATHSRHFDAVADTLWKKNRGQGGFHATG